MGCGCKKNGKKSNKISLCNEKKNKWWVNLMIFPLYLALLPIGVVIAIFMIFNKLVLNDRVKLKDVTKLFRKTKTK